VRLGAVTAIIVGLIGLAASAVGLGIRIMPRHFTASQQQTIISWEVVGRWRAWPAGEIFPASITYHLPAAILADGTGLALTARRVGIAPAASCAAVTDGAAARALARHGCGTVLRATYADATGAFIITVGVAVLPSARAATAAAIALSGSGSLRPGIRAAMFPGTLAEWSGDRARQISLSISVGPYLVMYAAGYADGRPRVARTDGNQYGRTELLSAAKGIAGYVAGKIGANPPPLRCPGAPGC